MRIFRPYQMLAVGLVCWAGLLSADALAQLKPAASAWPRRRQMTKPAKLISRQPPPIINKELESTINPTNSRAVVSLSKQRLYLITGDQVYIDTPVSTGKRAGMTPTGTYSIMQKDADHRSNLYGDFVDRRGRVVRSGISTRVDSAPAGTRYVGAPMRWFCRLTSGGIGFHTGFLPGYPASHGCIRLPADIAPIIYRNVRIGTSVRIES